MTEYLNFVRQEGGTVVHAHPFRQGKHIPFIRLNPELVDGVEVRNHNRPDAENRRNLWYAETFDLPRTAGSDAHKCSQIPPEVLGSETRWKSVADYTEALRRRTLILF